MIIIGKRKEEEEEGVGDAYKELEEFSKEIIKLGQQIESKLERKGELEGMIRIKEKEMSSLRQEIFDLKNELSKVKSELTRLEEKRNQAQEERNEL